MRFALAFTALTLSCSADSITFTQPMNLERQSFVIETCSHPEFCSDLMLGPGDATPGGYEAHITLPTVTFDPIILPSGSTITNFGLSYFAGGGIPNIGSALGPLCDEPCDWSPGSGSDESNYEYYDAHSVGDVNGELLLGGYFDGFGITPNSDSVSWTKLAAMIQAGEPLVINNELWTAFAILKGGMGPYNNLGV